MKASTRNKSFMESQIVALKWIVLWNSIKQFLHLTWKGWQEKYVEFHVSFAEREVSFVEQMDSNYGKSLKGVAFFWGFRNLNDAFWWND